MIIFNSFKDFIFDRLYDQLKRAESRSRFTENQKWVSNLKLCGEGLRVRGSNRISGTNYIDIGHNVHIGENAFIRGGHWLSNG